MGQKWGGGCAHLEEGELGPPLTQCSQGRGLPASQVSSWSVQPFGHSARTLQADRTDRQAGQTDNGLIAYGGRSRRHCVRWGSSSSSQKGDRAPPIFGPCLLWPNSWMDQDGTWYRCGPRSRPHCARWGPSSASPKRRHSPQFSAHLYCGQAAGCIKMPFGMEVGLSPGDFVLDGEPVTPRPRHRPHLQEKGHAQPHQFSAHVYCGQTAGLDASG